MSVTAATGFLAGAVHSGIRRRAVPDLAMVVSTAPATGAGMFTSNQVKAAPVLVSQAHLAAAEPQALVINSGVANAATGPRGELDAMSTAVEAARLLALDVEQVLVLSTGIIGVPLPLGKIRSGLSELIPNLSDDSGNEAAAAIMTTDTRPKTAMARGPGFTVGGMAKGAGMIHPVLATMLAVITTDYMLEAGEAIEFLRPAVEKSFNRISVDGECSTNDAVILLANGASGARRDDAAFAECIGEVCHELSRRIIEDGEGASMVIDVAVSGAMNADDARAVAERVSTSLLVKTASFGRDPNWGRVVAAAGSARSGDRYAAVSIDEMTVCFNGTKVLSKGRPTFNQPDMAAPVLSIDIDLGLGGYQDSYVSTDLSYEYVRINSEYTT